MINWKGYPSLLFISYILAFNLVYLSEEKLGMKEARKRKIGTSFFFWLLFPFYLELNLRFSSKFIHISATFFCLI